MNKQHTRRFLRIAISVVCVFAVLFAALFTYAYFNGRSGLHPNPDPEKNDIRIACVGDSITYGSTVTNWPKNNYPVLLDGLLGAGYTVHNYGISGGCLLDTSDKPYHSTGVYSESLAFDPDIVIIMIGTNDAKSNNWTNREDFKNQLIAFVNDYAEISSEIYLCTPCKAYSDAFNIQDDHIEEIVQVIHEVATEKGILLIDVRILSENNPGWLGKDGIHPNNDGAAAIAQAVYEAIQ